MGKPIKELGKRLKPPMVRIGATTGEIIDLSPLTVRINEAVVVKRPRLFYAQGLVFEMHDRVIVISTEDNQRFYIVAKEVSA